MVVHHKIRYSRVRAGHRHFEPTEAMKKKGFQWQNLGPEGPEARAKAFRLYEDWLRVRNAPVEADGGSTYPHGSVGWAWDRYRQTEAWAAKSASTRKKDWEWSWRWIGTAFGDVSPRTIEIEAIEDLYGHVLETKGIHTAHRVVKIWRALWKVMASFKLCEIGADPSKIVRNKAPKGRNQTWSEIEIIAIAKRAWRDGYKGLAALLAVAWDTQFAPVDCRTLTLGQRVKDRRGTFFDTARGKTGKAVIGTLSRRTVKIMDAYIAGLGFDLHEDAPIFRQLNGRPFKSKDLSDEFRLIRDLVFPGDNRLMLDIRRSGAVEALAGQVELSAIAAKMGNTIDVNKKLQETYLPRRAATVRLVDEARKRGRQILKDEE